MSNSRKRILVVGATGQVGGAVIRHLLQDKSVEVIAGARSPDKAAGLGVPAVYLDLDKFESLGSALKNVDGVFLATGYTVDMLRQSKDVVHAALQAGVQQIVHLGACGDDETRVDHYAWHQFIERYISSAGFEYYTHLRPEMFMQNLLGYGGAATVRAGVLHHYIGSARWSWVDCDDVAAIAAQALLDPKRHDKKTYRMGYEAMGFGEIAQMMTAILGQPFRYQMHPAEEFLRDVLAAGGEPAYMKSVYDCYRDFGRGTLKADEIFDNFPDLTGRKPRTLAQFVQDNAASFRY